MIGGFFVSESFMQPFLILMLGISGYSDGVSDMRPYSGSTI